MTGEERIQSGAAAGPSGQGNPYTFRSLDRATADPRLARFNPRQLVHRHRSDPDLNTTLLHCVDRLMLDHQDSRPRGTVVVDNTLAFRSILFEEYRTNLRTWPSLRRGILAPRIRQYVGESSPESDSDPELAPSRVVIDLDSSSSSGGRIPLVFIYLTLSLPLCFCICMVANSYEPCFCFERRDVSARGEPARCDLRGEPLSWGLWAKNEEAPDV